MNTTSSAVQASASTVDDQFLAVVCDDPDLLEAEFEAIIAAEWPDLPPTRPARRHARVPPVPERSGEPWRPSGPDREPVGRRDVAGWAAPQRSPPA